jgi:hypothetical protein
MYAMVALQYPVRMPQEDVGKPKPLNFARLVVAGAVYWGHPRIAATSAACQHLMQRMMDHNADTRITAGQALSHRWFNSIRAVAFQIPLLAAA